MNPDINSGDTAIAGASNPQAPRDNLVQMGDRPTFNFAVAIAWLIALLAILATMYFWWLSKNISDVMADKQTKLDAIDAQIKSPALVKAEKDANDFKTSVSILSKAKTDRFSVTTFLPDFYSKITKDVQISSLSLTSDGKISIAGTTKSYRTTADLTMALKSWTQLSDVQIQSVSMSAPEGGGNPKATFSISALVKKLSSSASATSATAPAATTGGQ